MLRYWLPVSHSGQNVIQLRDQSNRDAMLKMSWRHVPSVELGRAEHDNPVVTRRVVARELCEDVAAEGTCPEHGQDLEGDDGGVGEAPASVSARVLLP